MGFLVLQTLGELAKDADRKLGWSDSICTGLQLANFWQDVGPDWKKGRIYLPADIATRHGVSEAMIARGVATPEFRSLLADLCDRTNPMFVDGSQLASHVEGRLRIPILAFALAGLWLQRKSGEGAAS